MAEGYLVKIEKKDSVKMYKIVIIQKEWVSETL